MKTGIFVGLITLDCIYQTRKPLAANEKQVAEAMLLAAGGPATNGAIAFAALGNRAILVGALGNHPLSTVIREELAQHRVELVDLTPTATVPPPFSSIVVNVVTGDRAVISRNAADRPVPEAVPVLESFAQADCLLVDGHQMAVGQALAVQAQAVGIPVVIDAGSWKAGFEPVLSAASVVIASAAFNPPQNGRGWQAIAYLQTLNIPQVAITQGAEPILYWSQGQTGELPVPQVPAVDTLGAGDIFHGAFCHYFAAADSNGAHFLSALHQAARIASCACQYFGTRQWIQYLSR